MTSDDQYSFNLVFYYMKYWKSTKLHNHPNLHVVLFCLVWFHFSLIPFWALVYLMSLRILGQKRVSVDCCCHHIICWQFRIMFFCMSLIKMASFFFWLSFFPLSSSSLKLLFFYFLQNKKIAQPNKPYKIALFDNTVLSGAWFFKWHLVAAQATMYTTLDASYGFLDKLLCFFRSQQFIYTRDLNLFNPTDGGRLNQSIGQKITCRFWMEQVFNIQISWIFCPNLPSGGNKFFLQMLKKKL